MNSNIVRAWKDEFYRQSLSDEERAQLPANPVGELELTDTELEAVFGGQGNNDIHSYGPCESIFFKGNCYTHTPIRECVHPHYSIKYGDCYTYQHYFCHNYNTFDFRDCYPHTRPEHR